MRRDTLESDTKMPRYKIQAVTNFSNVKYCMSPFEFLIAFILHSSLDVMFLFFFNR
jgi:hypothetical protein